jgi:hypothetical protein
MGYRKVGSFASGRATALVDKKWGLIDRTGKLVVAP